MMAHERADGEVLRRRVTVTAVRRRTVLPVHGEPASGVRVPCGGCGREVSGLTPAAAAAVLRSDEEGLAALVDAGRVHAVRTVSGAVWICRDSLFAGGRP